MAQSAGKAPTSPASNEDIELYLAITTSVFCNARRAKVEFPTAVGIAAGSYAQVLAGRHGGLVEAAGTKKLTNEQLFNSSEMQIVTFASFQVCPDQVPADVKTKVEDALKKQKAAQ